MSGSPTNLAVRVDDEFVCVQIAGRAGCACSVDFRSLILGLREKGWRRFILDLTNCQLMDSTFLGVLAGLGLRFSEETTNGQPPATIELLNPSERISGLLENLGVANLFPVRTGESIATGDPMPECTPDRAELQRTSLEAHQLLIRLDPRNGTKFKDVCQYLQDDLLKLAKKENTPAAS